MKRYAILSSLTVLMMMLCYSPISWGNDTGWYAVQPFDAKYNQGSQIFEFSGQYAKEIKKLLPPEMASIAYGNPKLQKPYEKNFRGLLLKDAKGNALFIRCSSADLKYDDATKSSRVVPQAKTMCAVQMVPSAVAADFEATKVKVRDALTKARQSN